MEKEILDFFAERGLQLNKLIARRPPYLTAAQIKAGAKNTYFACTDVASGRSGGIILGRPFENISLTSMVHREAAVADYKEFENDEKILSESKQMIAERDRTIKIQYYALSFLSALLLFLSYLLLRGIIWEIL